MKKFLLATTASALLAPAAMADGIAYHGSEIGGQFWYNTDPVGSYTTHTVWASAQFAFAGISSVNTLFFQPQVALYDLDFAITGASVGGHLGMMPTPNLDLGLFATYNFWFTGGPGDLIFGPEAKGTAGPLEWEAYLALFYQPGWGLYGGVGRADISYDIGPQTALPAGGGRPTTGGGFAPPFPGGARDDLCPPSKASGTHTSTHPLGWTPNHAFGIKLTATFDDGVTFSPRDYMSVRLGF